MSAADDARLADAERAILARRPEHSIQPTLDRIAALTALLGDPQCAYPVIHITGTNGKTSTARMIETLLRERGLRTGLFTSPHLTSIAERICVDGEPLSAARFADAFAEIEPYLELVDGAQPAALSFFEVLTGMAFAVFADAPVDVAVIEVGMGGSWDCTNVADGAVAVITPVSVDHVQYLGSTVPEIAADKAGIIKPGAVAVLAQQPLDAATELLRQAARVGASVAREGLEFGVRGRELAVGGQVVDVQGLLGSYSGLFLPLFGAHQAANAACALAAVEALAGAAASPAVAAPRRDRLGVGRALPDGDPPDGGRTDGDPADGLARADGDRTGSAPADGLAPADGDRTGSAPADGDRTGSAPADGLAPADGVAPADGLAPADGVAADDGGPLAGPLDDDLVRTAFGLMTSPGRLEVVRRSPLVIVDAAHNPAGMAATIAALEEAFTFAELIVIMAVSEDKDVPGILDQLEPVTSRLIATGNSSARSMDPVKLAELAQAALGPDRVRSAARLDEAIELGVALADDAAAAHGGPAGSAAVLIAGSVITAGDARQLLIRSPAAAGRAGAGPAE